MRRITIAKRRMEVPLMEVTHGGVDTNVCLVWAVSIHFRFLAK